MFISVKSITCRLKKIKILCFYLPHNLITRLFKTNFNYVCNRIMNYMQIKKIKVLYFYVP